MLYKLFKVLAVTMMLLSTACAANSDSLNDEKVTLGYTKAYVIGQNYLDSINLFKKAGFDNIVVERLSGDEYANYRHGEVVDVKIGDLKDFNENTSIAKSDIVSLVYVANPSKAVNTLKSEVEDKTVLDFELFKASDHLLFNDSNDLGWEETWTITIAAEPNNLDWDDFKYTYDDSILDINAKTMRYDATKTYLDFELKSKKEGLAKIQVCAYIDGNNNCREFNVNALDEIEGRKVYLIPNENEFHYSEECPGDDVIATTYHFVTSKNIKPCPICQNADKASGDLDTGEKLETETKK